MGNRPNLNFRGILEQLSQGQQRHQLIKILPSGETASIKEIIF